MNNRVYYSQEAEERANRQRLLLAMIATGLGAALGGLLMLLFAPQSGVKTRGELGEQLEQSSGHMQHLVQQATNSIREQLTKAKEELEERAQALKK